MDACCAVAIGVFAVVAVDVVAVAVAVVAAVLLCRCSDSLVLPMHRCNRAPCRQFFCNKRLWLQKATPANAERQR